MSNILIAYNIQFFRRNILGNFRNIMISINPLLDQFITDYKTPDEINEFLIAEINSILNGTVASETIISESIVSANISISNTGLHQDPDYDHSSNPDYELPTIQLLEISQ